MATFNKFQDYVEQVNKAVHNWSTHTYKALLTNTAPAANDTSIGSTQLTDMRLMRTRGPIVRQRARWPRSAACVPKFQHGAGRQVCGRLNRC